MPKTTSTPSASRDRTSEPAPETWAGAGGRTGETAGVAAARDAAGSTVPAGSVAVRARRAVWARVSGVGLVMAVLAFGWSGWGLFSDATRAGRVATGSDGNKNGPRADARGQRTLDEGECAQVSTRSDRYDDMRLSLPHLTR